MSDDDYRARYEPWREGKDRIPPVKYQFLAQCQECDWEQRDATHRAVFTAAHRHFADTAHTVALYDGKDEIEKVDG